MARRPLDWHTPFGLDPTLATDGFAGLGLHISAALARQMAMGPNPAPKINPLAGMTADQIEAATARVKAQNDKTLADVAPRVRSWQHLNTFRDARK